MLALLGFALLCALSGLILPASAGDSVRRGTAFLAGVCILAAMCDPAAEFVRALPSLPARLGELLLPDSTEAEKIYEKSEEWVVQRGVRNIENGVRALIAEKFSLDTADITAEAETVRSSESTWEVVSLHIGLCGGTGDAADAVKAYLEELLSCPCSVVWMGEENGQGIPD